MKPLQVLQERAALLLATGHSVSHAARELCIHRSTIHLWRKRADFSALVEAEKCEAMATLRDQSRSNHREALNRVTIAAQAARLKFNPRKSEPKRVDLSKTVEKPHMSLSPQVSESEISKHAPETDINGHSVEKCRNSL